MPPALFDVDWSDLQLDDVRSFLADAGDEGVTWEAKADDDDKRAREAGRDPGELGKNTIRRAVCAFANQVGGYLIIGARLVVGVLQLADRHVRVDLRRGQVDVPEDLLDHPQVDATVEQRRRHAVAQGVASCAAVTSPPSAECGAIGNALGHWRTRPAIGREAPARTRRLPIALGAAPIPHMRERPARFCI